MTEDIMLKTIATTDDLSLVLLRRRTTEIKNAYGNRVINLDEVREVFILRQLKKKIMYRQAIIGSSRLYPYTEWDETEIELSDEQANTLWTTLRDEAVGHKISRFTKAIARTRLSNFMGIAGDQSRESTKAIDVEGYKGCS